MRRFVRDRTATALEREKAALEEYIAEHLKYPEAFPYHFAHAAVSIFEFPKVKVAALAKADYPPGSS